MSKFTQNIQERKGFIYNINFGLSVYRVAQLRYVCGFLCAILMFYFSVSDKILKNQVQSNIISYFSDTVSFCYFPIHRMQASVSFFLDVIDVYGENKRLKKDNDMMQEYILTKGYFDIRQESAEKVLSESLKLNGTIKHASVAYISRNASVAFLDIGGISEKVKINSAVLCGGGLAGRVVGIENNLAKVLMVDNSESFIPIGIAQTGVRGILHGLGKANSGLILMENDIAKIGDVVYAMSDDEFFKSQIPIGSVASADNGKYLVKTICDPYRLNYMTIIL
jgi:rod shape-determining protein MreC